MNLDRAENEGYRAGTLALGVLANPYAVGTDAAKAWSKGYREGYAS